MTREEYEKARDFDFTKEPYEVRSGVNRTLCSVLEEARKCYETRNFSPLLGLIEEAQIMGNRMESALYDKNDLEAARNEIRKIRKQAKVLQEIAPKMQTQVKELEARLNELRNTEEQHG